MVLELSIPSAAKSTPETEPYWKGLSEGELRFSVCTSCEQVVHYPRRFCPFCGSEDRDWRVSSGEGVVETFTVCRISPYEENDPPYSVCVARMDESFFVIGRWLDDEDDLEVGAEVTFRPNFEIGSTDKIVVPAFGLKV